MRSEKHSGELNSDDRLFDYDLPDSAFSSAGPHRRTERLYSPSELETSATPAVVEDVVGVEGADAPKEPPSDETVSEVPAPSTASETRPSRGKLRKSKATKEEDPAAELLRLSKRELLEIMLKQGEEIDALRAQIADLEAKLEERTFNISKIGSIAEASLAVTDIFKEAEKAAVIYLDNIRRMVDGYSKEQ